MRDGMRHYINPDELTVLCEFADSWEDLEGDESDLKVLVGLVRRLVLEAEEQSTNEIREVRRKAILTLTSDDLAVDDDAEVLKVENGHWIQSWTWMPE